MHQSAIKSTWLSDRKKRFIALPYFKSHVRCTLNGVSVEKVISCEMLVAADTIYKTR